MTKMTGSNRFPPGAKAAAERSFQTGLTGQIDPDRAVKLTGLCRLQRELGLTWDGTTCPGIRYRSSWAKENVVTQLLIKPGANQYGRQPQKDRIKDENH